jgi:hypothetical protein
LPSAQNSLQNICRQHLRDRRATRRGTSPAIYIFRDGDGKAESKQNKCALHSVHLYNTQSFRCIALLSFDRHHSMLCAAAGQARANALSLQQIQNKTQAVIGSLLIPDTPPRAALLTDGHLRISEGQQAERLSTTFLFCVTQVR